MLLYPKGSTNENTGMGQTYKVVFTLAETNKSVTMTVKTLAEKNSVIKLSISAKGRLETGKLNSEVIITPRWTNFAGGMDIEKNIRIYATARTKGSEAKDVTGCFDIVRKTDGTYSMKFKNYDVMEKLNFKDKFTVTAEGVKVGNLDIAKTNVVNLAVVHTKVRVTQSTKEVKLYQNDRYSRGQVRLTISDKTMPKIAAAELAEGGINDYYQLISLGNGWYALEYKGNSIAPKIKNGSIRLNVYLKGNNPENDNPNAIINIKVTNVKFKSNLR